MKKTRFLLAAIAFVPAFLFTACSTDSEKEGEEAVTEPVCSYNYDGSATTFEWTAYKFADKSGAVPGTFDNIIVLSDPNEDPKKAIESISFVIDTKEVNSQNEDRDKKISEFFFGTINTEKITGEIKELKDNGKAVIEVTMNGISFEVEGDYTLDGADFSYEATIDVSSWNGMPGIEALNKQCFDLHKKAPEEESKLWSDVTLKLTTKLKSDC